jgi:hypothetical protein
MLRLVPPRLRLDFYDSFLIDLSNLHIGRELANIWTILFALFPDLRRVISPDLINEPRNVITISEPLHSQFSDLHKVQEPTVSINQLMKKHCFPGA